MGLQLRVTEPLGDRVIDLDDRAADRPQVIGLDPGSDVHVRADGVAPRHCFLFVHDEQWFLQDARTQAGTLRNGRPVTGPTPIKPGDVITLGRGAAAPVLTVLALSVGAPALAAQAPQTDPPAPETSLASAVSSRQATYYIPRKRGASPAAITATILIALAIVIGGSLWLQSAYQKREEALKPHVIVVEAPPAATTTATSRPARVVRVVRAPGTSLPTTEPAEPPPDPRKSAPEWQAVESARYEDPPIAIIKFYDYLERFPDSPFKADVERYVEETVDRIWWQRLIELFDERDLATKQIDERKGQLALTADGDFKKTLETEIEEWQQRRTTADTIITKTMKYAGLGPPNPYDSAALAALRQQRDTAYYATWRDDVLKAVKRSRGQRLPWRGGR
jgi:hypothetical protein